jgi:UDP-N-acetylglucosamine 2-epimerase (non-hydrolysing)/GDP/UDP-N,N'-diacetylbacillosamine 2-epimerase (hydrolysing)
VIATYPNSDAGGQAMIGVLEGWDRGDWLHVTENLGQRRYASALKGAAAVVGNSSSGIIEAPFFGVPVVNIGTRQQGRLRADNVLDVSYDQEAIRAGVVCALTDEAFISRARHTKNPYGDGHAGERIVEVLASLEVGPALLSK